VARGLKGADRSLHGGIDIRFARHRRIGEHLARAGGAISGAVCPLRAAIGSPSTNFRNSWSDM
jgi:hypothetical protein